MRLGHDEPRHVRLLVLMVLLALILFMPFECQVERSRSVIRTIPAHCADNGDGSVNNQMSRQTGAASTSDDSGIAFLHR